MKSKGFIIDFLKMAIIILASASMVIALGGI